jgi:hypothetical protein
MRPGTTNGMADHDEGGGRSKNLRVGGEGLLAPEKMRPLARDPSALWRHGQSGPTFVLLSSWNLATWEDGMDMAHQRMAPMSSARGGHDNQFIKL